MTFEKIIETLGKRLGIELENAGGAVAVEVDGEAVVLQDAGEHLLLRAEIGEIPADAKEKILSSAMEANYLYQGTGGATLAVNPADGVLHLHKYNWMERLEVETLVDAIDKVADTAAAWRRILADSRHVASPGGMPPPDAGGDARWRLGTNDFMQV